MENYICRGLLRNTHPVLLPQNNKLTFEHWKGWPLTQKAQLILSTHLLLFHWVSLAWTGGVGFPSLQGKGKIGLFALWCPDALPATCWLDSHLWHKCTSRIQKCKHEASQACAHTQSRDCKPKMLLRWVCLIVRSRWCQLKQFSSKECIHLYFLSDNVWEFFAVNSCNEKKKIPNV